MSAGDIFVRDADIRIAELEKELDRAANEIHRLGMKCSQQDDEIWRLRELQNAVSAFVQAEQNDMNTVDECFEWLLTALGAVELAAPLREGK